MSVEAGARGALIAPDDKVARLPAGQAARAPRRAVDEGERRTGRRCEATPDAAFAREIRIDASRIEPMVTWGTSPDQALTDRRNACPIPRRSATRRGDATWSVRCEYMALAPGNATGRDPRSIAPSSARAPTAASKTCAMPRAYCAGAASPTACGRWSCPDRPRCTTRPKSEGLDRVFLDAGFEWRQSGCSMCVAMNDDHLLPGERCASSTNRNFEGRQGAGGRTHLMSPAMVAAAAIAGRLTDVRARSVERSMEPFVTVTGVAAPLPRANVDTDQIMPKQFLKGIDRSGLADGFLFDLRFAAPGHAATGIHPEPRALARRALPRRRSELRLRLEPRACRVGHAAARHPGRDRHAVRRHLLRQLPSQRRAGDHAAGARCRKP